MTYGWALLVVLIAIGALVLFGTWSPEKNPEPDNYEISLNNSFCFEELTIRIPWNMYEFSMEEPALEQSMFCPDFNESNIKVIQDSEILTTGITPNIQKQMKWRIKTYE